MRKEIGQYAGITAIALLAALILKIFVLGAVYVPSISMERTLLPGDYVLVDKLTYGGRASGRVPFLQSVFPLFRFPGVRAVSRGDIVIFSLPAAACDSGFPGEPYFVKRCIAVAGDRVALHDGQMLVNGTPVRLPDGGAVSGTSLCGVQADLRVPAAGDRLELNPGTLAAWGSLIRDEGHAVCRGEGEAVLVDGAPARNYTVERNYLFVLGDNVDHSYDSRSWGLLPEDNIVGKAIAVYWSVDPMSGIRWGRIGKLVM